MEEIYIENPNFGKCKVIALFLDIAVLEVENNYERYAFVIGLSSKTNTWSKGYYYRDFSKAIELFSDYLQDFYEIRFRYS